MKAVKFEIVIMSDDLGVDLVEVCRGISILKEWAYILHDKDAGTVRPHYHVYVKFAVSVDSELVAEWFKLGAIEIDGAVARCKSGALILKVEGKTSEFFVYLIHQLKSQSSEFHYDSNAIVSNFDVKAMYLEAKRAEEEQAALLHELMAFKRMEEKEGKKKVDGNF